MKVLLFCVLFIFAFADETRDALRVFSLGEQSDINLGKMTDTFFVQFVSWLPRYSMFSLTEFTNKFVSAPNTLNLESIKTEKLTNMFNKYVLQNESIPMSEVFDVSEFENIADGIPADPSADIFGTYEWGKAKIQEVGGNVGSQLLENDDIPDYFMGIFGTVFFGLIPIILTSIWACCMCCTGFYCLVCCFCDKSSRDRKKRRENEAKWRRDFKKKTLIHNIFRIFLLIFSIVVFIVFVIWSLFAFQSALGISNTIDAANQDYSEIENYAYTVLNATEDLEPLMEEVTIQLNETVEQVLDLIPIKLDTIDACIEEIKDLLLPNTSALTVFFDDFSSKVGSLSSVPSIDNIQTNITYYQNALNTTLNDADTLLSSISTTLTSINSEIGTLDGYLTDLTNSAFLNDTKLNIVKDALTIINDEKTSPLTQTFLTDLSTYLSNGNTITGTQLSSDLNILKTSIQAIKAIDTAELSTQLTELDINLLNTLISNIEIAINLVFDSSDILFTQLDSINTYIQSLNTTVESIAHFVDTLDLNAIKDDIVTLLNFDIIINELSGLTNFSNSFGCIDSIFEDIFEFNRTVLIFPQNITDLLLQFSDIDGLVNQFLGDSFNLTSILGDLANIDDVVDEQFSTILGTYLNITGDDIRAFVPTNITDGLQTVIDGVKAQLNAFNKTEILNQLDSVNSTVLGDLANFDSDMTIVNQLVTAIDDILALESDLDDAITAADTLGAGTCTIGTDCPAQMTTDIGTLKTAIDNLESQLYSVNLDDWLNGINAFQSSKSIINDLISYQSILGDILTEITAFDVSGFQTIISDTKSTIESLFPAIDFAMIENELNNQLNSFGFNVSTIDDLLGGFSNMTLTELLPGDAAGMLTMVDQFLPQITGFIDMIPEYMNLGKDTITNLTSNEFSMVESYIEQATGIKDLILSEYIEQFDGYRLLLAFFLMLLFIPIPALGIFAFCCHKKPGWLIVVSFITAIFAILFWMLSIIGFPSSILMNDGCNGITSNINTITSMVGNEVENIQINNYIPQEFQSYFNTTTMKELLNNGITSNFVNNLLNDHNLRVTGIEFLASTLGTEMNITANSTEGSGYGLDALFGSMLGDSELGLDELADSIINNCIFNLQFPTISIQELLENYMDPTTHCQREDIIETIVIVINNTVNEVLSVVINEVKGMTLPLDFQFADPIDQVILDIVQPILDEISNIELFLNKYIGCEQVNQLYSLVYDPICSTIRYSWMFLWGILALGAILLTIVSCVNCCTYCCLEHTYTSRVESSAGKFNYNEQSDDSEVSQYSDHELSDIEQDHISAPPLDKKQQSIDDERSMAKKKGFDTELEDTTFDMYN